MVLKLEVAGTCMCVQIVTLSCSCYCGPHLQLVCKSVLLHIASVLFHIALLVCFLLAAGTQNFLKLVLLCVLPFAACACAALLPMPGSYFGDAINACGGPFIDGLTITVQAEVYETYALSKQPPKPRNGYNSCRDLNLQRRLPYSTQPPHTSDGNPPYGGISEGVHRATAGPMPHSALALPAPGGSMVSDMINSRNPQLPHSSGIGMFSPHSANTPPHSPGMSSPHGGVHSHLGHNSHRAMEAPEDWSKPQPDSAPGNSTLTTPPPPTPYSNTPSQHQDEKPPQTAGPTSPATTKPSSSMGFLGSSTPQPAAGGSNPQGNPPPQGKTLDKTLDNTLASPKVPSEPHKASLPAANSPNALPTPGTGSSSAATGPAAAPPQQQQQPQAAAVQPAQTRPQPTLQDGLAAGSKDRTLPTGDNHTQAHGGSTLADPAPMGDSAEGIYGESVSLDLSRAASSV